jgi:hypothetical protein
MNWKLIFQLSLFGLAMAFATIFLIPPTIEPLVWLPIFLFCAYIIAKRRVAGRFLHGVVLGLANCVWITTAHLIFITRYLAGHPQEAAITMQSMPTHPRLLMAITGPAIGLISGLLIGLFALAAGKLMDVRSRTKNRNTPNYPAYGGVLEK